MPDVDAAAVGADVGRRLVARDRAVRDGDIVPVREQIDPAPCRGGPGVQRVVVRNREPVI